MHLTSLVQMVESAFAGRTLLGQGEESVEASRFGQLVRSGAATLGDADAVVYVGESHPLLPVALFAAAWRGVPFAPVNYRLDNEHMNALIERSENAVVLTDERTLQRVSTRHRAVSFDAWMTALPVEASDVAPADDEESVAVVLYTSGTTAAPKSALLRHRHLMAYLIGSVEFGSAGDDEAVLVSVPPYHVAGIANMLSNLFAGRRLVYLQGFDPLVWLDTVRREAITNAMVVPTMLARIVDALEGEPADVPSLRTLSYGGAKLSERVLRQALDLFPAVGFVNAYGLTETASTIAVLGPDDHRAAITSPDPLVQARLSSAGRLLPSIEIEVRADDGGVLAAGEVGIIHLRGEQISGEYATGSLLDADGWFCTRDRGSVDADGYLFIEGRADDTIIRGGENIAPAEIEEALLWHHAVADACVVGVPDDEWGQRIAASVVLRPGVEVTDQELKDHVRAALRGSKTPDVIDVRTQLPRTDTGKLLRRVIAAELSSSSG